MGYFTLFSASSEHGVERRWTGEDLEGKYSGLNEQLFQNFPGGTKENHKVPQSGESGAPTEIWTQHLRNAILEVLVLLQPARFKSFD
jgi:hypothetical protein